MSGFLSLTDESSEEEEVKAVTKVEDEVDMAHSWMEVGGMTVMVEEEAQGLLHQIFLPAWYCSSPFTILSLFYGLAQPLLQTPFFRVWIY